MHIIGIDAGGTRTRAVLVSTSGTVEGHALAGAGNFQRLGVEGMGRHLEQLLMPFRGRVQPAAGLCLAAAGAGRSTEQEALTAMLATRGWATQNKVISDAQAAVEGAHAGGPGIVLIAGTGSIAMGKNAAGRWARAGGWGPVLGDEGSGYAIGLAGLRAVLQARDNSGEPTRLTQMLQTALGLETWDELVPRVYGGALEREAIAALAPHIFLAAEQRDPVSERIVDAAGRALGRLVWALAGTLDMEDPPVACLGGVFAARRQLWPALTGELARKRLGLQWHKPWLPPVLGAVLVAARQTARPFGEQQVERLRRSCPVC